MHSFFILNLCFWIVAVDRDSNMGQMRHVFREQHLKRKANLRFHLLFPAPVPWLSQRRIFVNAQKTGVGFTPKDIITYLQELKYLNLIFMFTPLFFSMQLTRPVEIPLSLLNVSYLRGIVSMG